MKRFEDNCQPSTQVSGSQNRGRLIPLWQTLHLLYPSYRARCFRPAKIRGLVSLSPAIEPLASDFFDGRRRHSAARLATRSAPGS